MLDNCIEMFCKLDTCNSLFVLLSFLIYQNYQKKKLTDYSSQVTVF